MGAKIKRKFQIKALFERSCDNFREKQELKNLLEQSKELNQKIQHDLYWKNELRNYNSPKNEINFSQQYYMGSRTDFREYIDHKGIKILNMKEK